MNYLSIGLMLIGLLWGALTGYVSLLIVPCICGLACFIIGNIHARKLERKAESWRAQYPTYKY